MMRAACLDDDHGQKNKPSCGSPRPIRRKAGLNGREVEFRATDGVITIVPKAPLANDEYTPEQQRVIDARLAEARKGPYHGPFENADEAVTFLRKEIRKRSSSKRKRSNR